ncbi:MAG: NADH-quinone oxidoreductase subunit H [Sulfuricurvum sp.]|jgi:NADH-quinone oxidoreductase subunit H|uniref:complex I subunit 1/NuoH family protein n=1 Tax=Sulfuricurvum sp. TaxID=2025608 RepID=UPI0025D37485|nr:complex I subunit 1 family protein [Sulfuricurvum sp.]MCK9371811.1 NADH-quinone oxidoreductase subunit H [Sulfuricurvum sp.]
MNSWMTVVPILIMVLLSVGIIPLLIWMERRIASMVQNRLGPNRCNIHGFRLGGIVQSIADVIKLLYKEDFYPRHIRNRFLFLIAPVIVFVASFLTFAVIPFADTVTIHGHRYAMQALPTTLGILWFLALTGLGIYGIIIAGWSSHNKFGILGALRASSQLISYEIAMGLSLVSMILTYDTIHLNDMVAYQSQTFFGFLPAWGILIQPLAALIFVITAFAETNRAPFDVAEGESEIVAGYHTEYSAMKFGLFFVGEYLAMTASAALIVTLFLGGYTLPWVSTEMMLSSPDLLIGGLILGQWALFVPLMLWIRKNNLRRGVVCNGRERERHVLLWLFGSILLISTALLGTMLAGVIDPLAITLLSAGVQVGTFILKLFAVIVFFIVVRWTFPRFRYDQIQYLGWYILLPLGLINIFITAFAVIL